jgi:hypothetical protein
MDALLSPKDSLLSPTWEENESRFGCLDSKVFNLKSRMFMANFVLLLDLSDK